MFRKVILVFFVFFFPWSAGADVEGYFCVADISSGFSYNKTSEKWIISRFNVDDKKYIIKRPKIAGNKWEVVKLGEQIALIVCKEDFNTSGFLFCKGTSEFKFNKKNLRYLKAYLFGYYNVIFYIFCYCFCNYFYIIIFQILFNF